ncbi:MAG: CHAD domain-containing protein, partial [Candidatus Eiseniibacteriota bacterium]
MSAEFEHGNPSPEARAARAALLRADFAARGDALADAARRVREQTDSEAIHDLRVASRRLAEGLGLWRALLDPDAVQSARRSLRRLRRRIGPTREREVHREQIEARLPEQDPAVRLAAESVVRRLARRIERGRRRSARAAREGRIERLLGRLDGATATLESRMLALPEPNHAARARAGARREAAVLALDRSRGVEDDAVLHGVRIAVKKARYAEECLSVVDSDRGGARADHLRKLQQVLGTVHDRAVLAAWLARIARRWT